LGSNERFVVAGHKAELIDTVPNEFLRADGTPNVKQMLAYAAEVMTVGQPQARAYRYVVAVHWLKAWDVCKELDCG
jgi:hypothetical protein